MRPEVLLIAIAPFVLLSIVDGFFRGALQNSPALFWLFDPFKFVVLPIAALLWLARTFFVTPDKYGLASVAEHESWLQFLGFTLFLTALLYLIYQAADMFFWMLFGRPETASFYKNMAPTGLLRVPVVLYFAATAGLVEEIFFRALPLLYLQQRFPKSIPTGLYVLSTSALFGVSHWENGAHEVLATFTYGIFASLFYVKLRDLWPLVGAHALIDLWVF